MINHCYLGDNREQMKLMLDEGKAKSVQTIVTSPPYYGLRDYGVDGQLGLEETPQQYIDAMVDVFRCARDLLADDGTLWLNIGDSYAMKSMRGEKSAFKETSIGNVNKRYEKGAMKLGKRIVPIGCKPKDLIGIPWMLAFALRADGWYLRQDIIWHKPNPMPESVTDRCTKSHEYIFLLSKSSKYYFDNEAIQEMATGFDGRKDTTKKPTAKYMDTNYMPSGNAQSLSTRNAERWRYKNLAQKGQPTHSMHEKRLNSPDELSPIRNKRSVWTIPTKTYQGAHFAVFPEALVEPCILAGSKVGDVVFDPFMGSGTVGQVAQNLGRKWLGCELNPEYIKLQKIRTSQQAMEFA